MNYPPWLVLHIPHDSTDVPSSVREQFLLDDVQLRIELDRMTDHHTLALFSDPTLDAQIVRAPVSRLVVDVERFVNDDNEPMAYRGMGAVYMVTSHLKPLRRPLGAGERDTLIQAYYIPHHLRLEAAVTNAIEQDGRCLVLDCHSFPTKALPYELVTEGRDRPDICIGTDDFHTSDKLANGFVTEFERAGFKVGVNDPFAGALVPVSRYRRDHRVSAIMVEVNRALYLCGSSSDPSPEFAAISRVVRQCCVAAIKAANL